MLSILSAFVLLLFGYLIFRDHKKPKKLPSRDKHYYAIQQLDRALSIGKSIKNVDKNGDITYKFNGIYHRTDGPAVELTDGSKMWYKNGEYHREDGPAVDWANGNKYWYINGKQLTEEEFNKRNEPTKTVEDGTIYYKLKSKLHREDGLAVEYTNGTKQWYIKGRRHREDGPAIENANGTKKWYINGKELTKEEFDKRPIRTVNKYGTIYYKLNTQYHREDGPAVELADGEKHWYKNGKYHREDGPAVEATNGAKHWYINGVCHRNDGPACEWANGPKYWYINGKELTEEEFNKRPIRTVDAYGTIHYKVNNKLHREDGPAVELADGTKYWYKHGLSHRENGPAIEYANGNKFWYINGQLQKSTISDLPPSKPIKPKITKVHMW